jgi:hypothetical protein
MAGAAQMLLTAAESRRKSEMEVATKQLELALFLEPAANDNAYRITKEQVGLAFGVMFSGAHWVYWRMFVG